jgi:nucleoporin NUP42
MSSVMTTISGGALARAAASARAGGKGSRATRAVEHRPRGARGAARDAASEGDDADGDAEQPVSQTRKRSPKPLPSSFGEGKVTGKKTLPFQDPFETNKSIAGVGSAKDATSPFDMPAATLDAPAKSKAPAAAAAASPFGAPAPAKPASPFGAAAPAAPPASPFGAANPAETPAASSPFADAAPKAGASPFASAGAAANPFGDVKPAKAPVEDTRTAWEKLPKPAMAQVVIVLSFTTIISLMLATFWVVVQLGGVSFNDS